MNITEFDRIRETRESDGAAPSEWRDLAESLQEAWIVMVQRDFSRLERPRHPMPKFVRDALVERDLMGLYKSRPAY